MSEAADMIALCNRFFDAIERRDMVTIGQCLHPDLQFWANFTKQTKGREDILTAIENGYSAHRRRLYNDRRIRPFDGGFLSQHTCEVTRHDGSKSALWAGLVAKVADGMIIRVDEYMDAGKFGSPPPKPAEASDSDAKGEASDA